jgi:hypothetical protein
LNRNRGFGSQPPPNSPKKEGRPEAAAGDWKSDLVLLEVARAALVPSVPEDYPLRCERWTMKMHAT